MKPKNTFYKIILIISAFSFLCYAFWSGIYYLDGLLYYKYIPWDNIKGIIIWAIVSLGILSALIAIGVFLLQNPEKPRKYKPFLAGFTILLICAMICASFSYMIGVIVGTPMRSYTEDIENYGKYDEYEYVPVPKYFPDEISEDMQVINFAYYYRHLDFPETDFFLEVKFQNEETMQKHLDDAISSLGTNKHSYQNPYDPSFTDYTSNTDDHITFFSMNSYDHYDIEYNVISYSFEKLTIIYNATNIGDYIDTTQYYPKILKRFNIEHDQKNNFSYRPK